MQENKMGVMPMGKLLFSMSWPATLSMLIQALYNIVDCIFVAAVSENALTAVTLAFPIQMLMIALGVGTGIGINSLIARRLGAKKLEDANMAASNGFRLSLLNWAVFAVFGLFFARPYMEAYADIPYIVENGTKFLAVVTTCSLFIMVQINNEKILQSTGNMVMPMICSLTGVIINVILAPIFIFGFLGAPEMGVLGAAYATVTGQFISMCLGLYFLFFKSHAVQVKIRGFKMNWRIVKEIYLVGLPSILMQSIVSVMLFGLNMILTGISETAVAVLGSYYRLQSFIFMPVFGINQGAMPVFAFNYGAKNKKRLMKAFKYSMVAVLGIMIFGLALFQIIPKPLLLMFSASDQMLAMGVPALRLISICFPAAAVGIVCFTMFQATGHAMLSMWGSLIRQLLGILPIAWMLSKTANPGVTVWAAFPLAEILGLAYCLWMMRYIYRKEIKYMEQF